MAHEHPQLVQVAAYRGVNARASYPIYGLRVRHGYHLVFRQMSLVTLVDQSGAVVWIGVPDPSLTECPLFRGQQIEAWLLVQGGGLSWPRGKPPLFIMTQIGPGTFQLP